MPEHKMKSVIELAKYRVGEEAWWVILRPIKQAKELPEADQWMLQHHPKALYEHGPGKAVWGKTKLPKLQCVDFQNVLSLLTNKVLVEKFIICDILRSRDTGEFFYSNENDEWMPESSLMVNRAIATQEKHRIMRLIENWAKDNK